MPLFSPEMAREHHSPRRSLCSNRLSTNNQTSGSDRPAGCLEDALHPSGRAAGCSAGHGVETALSPHPPTYFHPSWVFTRDISGEHFGSSVADGNTLHPEYQPSLGQQLPASSWYSAGVAAGEDSPVLFSVSLLGY